MSLVPRCPYCCELELRCHCTTARASLGAKVQDDEWEAMEAARLKWRERMGFAPFDELRPSKSEGWVRG